MAEIHEDPGTNTRPVPQLPLEGFVLHALLTVVAFAFNRLKVLDARFGRAVAGYDAVYVFSTPSSERTLVFGRGRIRTRRGRAPSPDFEISILDPPGALRAILRNPDDPISLVVQNKIEQSGNLFFLYKLGSLFGLSRAYLNRVAGGVPVWRKAVKT
ncbi:MAG: hypothetical protein KKF41_03440 [Actinobacteria bacterium]|nr:hypothetical protein [Actinomycetota bacterium]MBU1945044.1 hypothetical protein [Actinomycetota bacterium]MBU2686620.1 hypothetical protein [Actinomycetota bacterium]